MTQGRRKVVLSHSYLSEVRKNKKSEPNGKDTPFLWYVSLFLDLWAARASGPSLQDMRKTLHLLLQEAFPVAQSAHMMRKRQGGSKEWMTLTPDPVRFTSRDSSLEGRWLFHIQLRINSQVNSTLQHISSKRAHDEQGLPWCIRNSSRCRASMSQSQEGFHR